MELLYHSYMEGTGVEQLGKLQGLSCAFTVTTLLCHKVKQGLPGLILTQLNQSANTSFIN